MRRFSCWAKKAVTLAAISGPTPRRPLSSASPADSRASSVPACAASTRATCSPTWAMPSAKSSRERLVRRLRLDRGDQVAGGFLGQSLERQQVLRCRGGRGRRPSCTRPRSDQLVDQLLAEPLDVQRAPGGEVPDRLPEAGRAGQRRAAPRRLALLAADGRPARGAEPGEDDRRLRAGPQGRRPPPGPRG